MKLIAWVWKQVRLVFADTIALYAWKALTFVLPFIWEYFLGVSFRQSLRMRGLSIIYSIVLAIFFPRIIGLSTDFMVRTLPGTKTSKFMYGAANGIVLWMFQMPFYVTNTYFIGITNTQMILAQTIFFIECPVVGYLYGKMKNRMREACSVDQTTIDARPPD